MFRDRAILKLGLNFLQIAIHSLRGGLKGNYKFANVQQNKPYHIKKLIHPSEKQRLKNDFSEDVPLNGIDNKSLVQIARSASLIVFRRL